MTAATPVTDALEQVAPPAEEPVAWQHQIRVKDSSGAWSNWADGRAPEFVTQTYEARERPLYGAPLSADDIRAEARRAALEEAARIADAYAERMRAKMDKRHAEVRPLTNQQHKLWAARSIASAIREAAR